MSANSEHAATVRIVEALRAAFPEQASRIDEALDREGYEDAPHTWIERFSLSTTAAIKRGDSSTAVAHLSLVSRLLATGDESTSRCIDVAYVESLMWDIKDEKIQREGWKLVPQNLRRLYVGMWGEKPFMKARK
ncbi:DUF7674 family protein [Rubrivivax sp. RP6-9]|uniref:DUF7674 family protein n=1 Tax=Rubrivivax sp. RP6-9 TaxID=3415750 RepID=UPI003CC59ADB